MMGEQAVCCGCSFWVYLSGALVKVTNGNRHYYHPDCYYFDA